MKELGIKILTSENWLERDDVLKIFHRVQPDNSTRPILPNEWIIDIQKPQLYESVPFEVKKLFEVARGTMIYGYFFYPIFTLATEQFTRISETAIKIKYNLLNGPKSRKSFKNKVEWLNQESIFSNNTYENWKFIIRLRNEFSHPAEQKIFNPAMSIILMNLIVENINQLFIVG